MEPSNPLYMRPLHKIWGEIVPIRGLSDGAPKYIQKLNDPPDSLYMSPPR